MTPTMTDADYRKIITGLAHLAQMRDELERAQRAGLPMDEPLAALDAYQFQLDAIKKEFFPDRP